MVGSVGAGIDTGDHLEGGLDACIPTTPEECLYIYFPIYDDDLRTSFAFKRRLSEPT